MNANRNKFSMVFYKLIACAFLVYCLSEYIPINSRAIFYVGLMLPGTVWLLWKPLALPAYFKAFGALLLPLAAMQLLNIHDITEIKPWLLMTVFLACCVLVERSEWGVDRVYRVFALVGIFILCYATADWLWVWHHGGKWIRYQQLFGGYVDPNNVATFITSALVFFWLTAVEPELRQRPAWFQLAGLITLCALALLAASVFQSRSALVGFGLFMAGYIVMRRMWGLGLLALIGTICVGYVAGASQMLSQRGLSVRPQIWADAWHRIVDTCGIWLGCGQDGYLILGMYTHTHNMPLGILYKGGLLGLALFSIFAYVYVRDGMRLKTPWFLMSLIGIGSLLTNTGWFLYPVKAYWGFFWVPVLFAFIQMRREQVDRFFEARR